MQLNSVNHPKLAALSDIEIRQCYELYKESEHKNSELIKMYGLDGVAPSALFKLFPPFPTTLECPVCSQQLFEVPTSKAHKIRSYACTGCGHRLIGEHSAHNCECNSCEAKREELKRQQEEAYEQEYRDQLAALKSIYPEPATTVDYNDLSLLDKVYLAALLPSGSDNYLPALSQITECQRLSPAGFMDDEIYAHLIGAAIIYPVVDFLDPSIVMSEEEALISQRLIYRNNVRLKGVAHDEGELLEAIHDQILKDFEQINLGKMRLNKQDVADLSNLIMEVEVAEASAFLNFYCYKSRVSSPPSKMYALILKLLMQLSVSELAPLIKRSVENAALSLTAGDLRSKQHAANVIPSHLERMVAYSQKKGWTLTHWGRLNHERTSNLTDTIYNKLLAPLKVGFYQPAGVIVEKMLKHFKDVSERPQTLPSDNVYKEANCKQCEGNNLEYHASQIGTLVLCLDCYNTTLLEK